ncbi:hypothetical protein SLA2020_421210 [Shorea laevis]
MIGLSRLTTVAASPPLYRLARLALSRFYSGCASAAAQLQADYYYYGADSESERLAAAGMADSEGSAPNRGVQWVFIGSPGAKRHVPQPSLFALQTDCKCCQSWGTCSRGYIFGLLSKRLEDGYYRGENGFILDGIPRSPIQAEILDQLAEIDRVVNFKFTEDCLVEHQGDGTWKEKLQVYAKQSKPLEEYYRKQKKLLDFQVCSAPGETWRGLLAALHLQHINAACSSHKLTTGFDWL